MSTFAVLACMLVASACGRIGFDAPASGTDSDASPELSCYGMPSACGPSGTSPCCGTTAVTGGTFYRSYDVGADNAHTDMTSPATVSDFKLDIYEVTVGRFRQFVEVNGATQLTPPRTDASARVLNGVANQGGWMDVWNQYLAPDRAALLAALKCNPTFQTWTDTPGANEALPINCITWYEAFAFCYWDGGFLPTEAEWNYAAAGGSEQRAYPWSSPPSSLAIDCSYANYLAGTTHCTNPPNGGVSVAGSRSPNGDGKFGQVDLAGNVWEWTLDGYVDPYDTPCTDCAELTMTANRVVRGGGFADDESYGRGARRFAGPPTNRDFDVGVRCARATWAR